MALGLNGHLVNLDILNLHDSLAKVCSVFITQVILPCFWHLLRTRIYRMLLCILLCLLIVTAVMRELISYIQ